jgi:hypothetical protein
MFSASLVLNRAVAQLVPLSVARQGRSDPPWLSPRPTAALGAGRGARPAAEVLCARHRFRHPASRRPVRF